MSRYDKGGVSIFIVVFTALMVTIVTASFVQIVLRNQQIASNNDLSQSAYDSAMAGVEDAKRALVALRDCENDPADPCENAIRTALNSDSCDTLQQAGVVSFVNDEVMVGAEEQNQAYTCVKVQLNTEDVSKELQAGVPVVIPLKSSTPFDTVRLSWFNAEDRGVGVSLDEPTTSLPPTLPQQTNWPSNRPPLMRAQLIQFRQNDLQLSQFEQGNARTLFLVPSSNGTDSHQFALDGRMNPASSRNVPLAARCNNGKLSNDSIGYACQVELTLPNPVGGTANDREAYLQLLPMYNDTTLKVELLNGSTEVEFNGIQPEVDSTGRASDLFRRVRAKLTVTNGARDPFLPNAALSVEGNLCKDFFITDTVDEYDAGSCEPND